MVRATGECERMGAPESPPTWWCRTLSRLDDYLGSVEGILDGGVQPALVMVDVGLGPPASVCELRRIVKTSQAGEVKGS